MSYHQINEVYIEKCEQIHLRNLGFQFFVLLIYNIVEFGSFVILFGLFASVSNPYGAWILSIINFIMGIYSIATGFQKSY